MENKDSLTIIVEATVLVLIFITFCIGFFDIFKIRGYQNPARVLTDKIEYNNGNALKIKIANKLKKNICFSSCYPYYFEKKITNKEWRVYNYPNCLTANLSEKCLELKQIKAFEIILPALQGGIHRIAVPVCIGCNNQETFKKDEWIYSNEFIIKE